MKSLISFDGFADVANNLIDKIAATVGWAVNHNTPKKEAINTYIKGIQESDLDPLTKAALISGAKKAVKEYQNQHHIVENAVQYLKPNAVPHQVNDDWLTQFFDKARLVADSDFQLIWGKILAEECNTPGTIPKGLLHVLEQMDKQHAEAFRKVCSCVVCCEANGKIQHIPIIPYLRYRDYFDSIGLSLDTLIDLNSIGLIKVDLPVFGDSACLQRDLTKATVWYFDNTYTLPEHQNFIDTGNVVFTRIGTALYAAVGQERLDGFFEEYCLPFWQAYERHRFKGE